MKHIRIFSILAVLALALLAFSSCGSKSKEEPKQKIDITGSWNLTGATTKSASIGGTIVDVYINFDAANTFVMYQMMGQGRYESFDGTWTLTDDLLSGKYSDGTSWASNYTVSVNGSTMTMSPVNAPSEVYTYTKKSIPDDIK